MRPRPKRCRRKEPKPWPAGLKLSRGRHGEVELQRLGKEEDAIDRRTLFEVGEMERVTVVHKLASPVTQDVADECPLNDAEREIQVRVAVSRVDRERAHRGACYDALILRGEREHVFAQCVALLNREHGQKLSRRRVLARRPPVRARPGSPA